MAIYRYAVPHIVIYGLYSYGLYSCSLYSYDLHSWACIVRAEARITYIAMACIVMALHDSRGLYSLLGTSRARAVPGPTSTGRVC